jgi:hypothetical protein
MIGEEVDYGFRRALVHRFPFTIIYAIEDRGNAVGGRPFTTALAISA